MTSKRLEERDPFTANQKVWLIDNVPTERDAIRQRLSPEVVTIETFDQLISEVSGRLNGSDEAYGTLIYTDHLNEKSLRPRVQAIVDAINNELINNRLFIYHITDTGESPFNNAHIYEDIDSFLADANNIHLESISLNDNVDEETRKVIRDLRLSNAKQRKNNKALREENEKYKDRNKNLEARLEGAKKQKENAELREEHAQQERADAEAKQKDLEVQLSVNEDEIKAKQQEIDKLTHTKLDLQAQIKGKESFITELTQQNNQLQQAKDDLSADLAKKQEEAAGFAEAKTGLQAMSEVQENLDAAQDLIREQKNEIRSLQSKVSLKDSQIKRLQDEVDSLRHSGKKTSKFGLDADVYPVVHLGNTSIIYFKIIDPLDYHRFYINFFVSQMRKMFKDSYDFTTIMLKQDNGCDSKRWDNCVFIGNMSGISDAGGDYYLVPSKNMNDGVFEFEQHLQQNKPAIVVVLDYIDNNKYYFSSDAIMDKFVVAKNSRKARRVYNVAGKYISYDHRSDVNVDWHYDRRLMAMTSQNRDTAFLERIKNLIGASQVVMQLNDELFGSN